ncbi:hypothetical protein MMPV_008536 [Pyropia vietnamensis]
MSMHGDQIPIEALAWNSSSGLDDDSGCEQWSPSSPAATTADAEAVSAATNTGSTTDASVAAATVKPPPKVFKQGHPPPAPLGAPVAPPRPYPPLPPDPDTPDSLSCAYAAATTTATAAASVAAVAAVDTVTCPAASFADYPPVPAQPPSPLWDDRDVRAVERTASAWMRSALAAGAATAALLRLDGGAPFAAVVAVVTAAAVGVGAWRRSVNVAAVCKGEVRPARWVVWGLAVGGGGLVLTGGLVVGGVAA